jgi:predicted nucleic acid-binding Zn ribbon protein
MELTKCPECGAEVQKLDVKCSSCNHILNAENKKPVVVNWTKIYIGAVLVLNCAVLFLVVTGERRKIFWFVIAVMAFMTFVLARLKIKRNH